MIEKKEWFSMVKFGRKNFSKSIWKRLAWGTFALGLLTIAFPPASWGVRVKDIAFLRGARDNQLIGYGLVVGLDGTGDAPDSLLARKPLKNALERMSISLSTKEIKGRSIAGVLVTATLPPFAKAGSRINVTVDTLGDAVSLRGGTLMYTLLYGANQVIFATAQGVMTGIPKGIERAIIREEGGVGLQAEQDTSKLLDPRTSMVATKGYVLNGGLVEKELNLNLNTRSRIFINLKNSDFTTAFRLAKLINRELGDGSARAKDAGTVEISVPDSYLGQTVELVSRIENLNITPDSIAKVVVDDRTGTIVMGQNVRISPIAISHGNLSLEIQPGSKEEAPSAPTIGPQGQTTGGTPQAAVAAASSKPPIAETGSASIMLFKGEVDLKEVVDGLNKIGASSTDLVQVLKIIKSAGALHADLIIQ